MKKIIFILLITTIACFSQWKSFSFKVGVYTPYNLKTGFVYGIDYGTYINENVAFIFGADLYYKSIRNDSYLTSAEKLGVKINTGQRLSEWVGWHLPITAKLKVEFPLPHSPIYPYAIGGIGYGVTRVSFETFNNAEDESEANSITYNGFVWQLGGGIFYKIGYNSNLVFEVIHNAADFEKEERYNTFSSLNSSGVMFRAGIDFAF
ncbi:MAG: hypothetical protein C4539_12895 [Ignavibacteriales bacterium]|nr:MAG: hypothetical protein C4539_12895 [Ignavibacteriales bacterium]